MSQGLGFRPHHVYPNRDLNTSMPSSRAVLATAAVALLSTRRGNAVPLDDDADGAALVMRCTDRFSCSGHGNCTASGSCACDKNYEGARCDVWRSSHGSTTSLAGLVDLKWHNCTHDAEMRQRCTRENSTICERAGASAPLPPSCPPFPPIRWHSHARHTSPPVD